MLLDKTAVTDAGMAHLSGQKKLVRLYLRYCNITDASVPELSKLTSLTELHLVKTKVTDDGIAKLEKALPGCRISRP